VNDSATAESVCRNLRDPALAPLFAILSEHRAAPKCQFDAFAEYVAAAEEHGVENYPLYQWTKATIVEADLQPLATSGLIKRISKYDTNPANNPQSPQRPRERN
jgi:hypothetical protein